jgi:hypothetical protein
MSGNRRLVSSRYDDGVRTAPVSLLFAREGVPVWEERLPRWDRRIP